MQKFPDYAVLIVEDVWPLALTYQAILKRLGCKVTLADTAQAALRLLEHHRFACAMIDLGLPDMHGFDLMAQLLKIQPDCAVVVITADDALETAVQATHAGAVDFLQKPIDPDRLLITLRNTLSAYHLKTQIAQLEAQTPSHFAGFIGKSPAMRGLYQMIQTVATSRAPVIITGESGTGKELAARAIHDLSLRKDKPFVAINCAAIAKDLIESELFGHIKGAYTGAHSDRKGAFLEANGGTLFLDEIAEMTLDVQAKVLRTLQSGEVRSLGDNKVQLVNIRVVCATHRDLQAMVQAQSFRQDLYYRLHVIPLEIPALRQRGDDVLLIANSLLKELALEDKKDFQHFSPQAQQLLLQHHWPGNVRELINTVRATVALYNGVEVQASMIQATLRALPEALPHEPNRLDLSLSPAQVVHANASSAIHAGVATASSTTKSSPPSKSAFNDLSSTTASTHVQANSPTNQIRPLAQIEREAIEQAITICSGNVVQAAQALHVNASTLYRKMAQWAVVAN